MQGLLCACRSGYRIDVKQTRERDVGLVFNPFNFLLTSDHCHCNTDTSSDGGVWCWVLAACVLWLKLSFRFLVDSLQCLRRCRRCYRHFASPKHTQCTLCRKMALNVDSFGIHVDLVPCAHKLHILIASSRLCLMLVYIIGIIINSLHHLIYKH